MSGPNPKIEIPVRMYTRAIFTWPVVALLIALVMYFGVGLTNLKLPGLQYDEAADAVPAMEVLKGEPPNSISTITLFGRQWPLMMLHHIGPTSIYTSLIGLSLLGISVESLRTTQLIVGAIGLVLLWLLAHSWFSDLIAIIAVLLCATAPAFIWWNRAGANWTAPLLPLALGMLLALGRWWRTRGRSRAAFIVTAFLFGLGFTTKILFIWLIAPLGLTALIAIEPRRVWQAIRETGWLAWIGAALALLLGLSPFIIHNIPNGDTFRFILSNAAQTRIYGHNNLDLLNNLRVVVDEFIRMMGGDTLHFRAPAGLLLSGIAFVASLIYMLVMLIRSRAMPQRTARWFLVLTPLTVLPLSTISTSGIGATYVFIIVPLAWLLVAVALSDLIVWLRARNIALPRGAAYRGGLGGGIVALLVLNHLVTNALTHRYFIETGGRGFWSDSIYELAEKLQTQYADRPIVAMDWGFNRNLAFLTENKVRANEVFEYAPEPSPKFEDMSTVLLRDPQHVYLFHAPDTTAFRGHWEVFERAALKSHKQVIPELVLREHDGVTNTLIYTAQPAPRNFTPPANLNMRNARFDDALTLLGGDVKYDPTTRELSILLHWQSNVDRLPNDTVLLHIVDQSNGNVVMVADKQPVYGSYPFGEWQRGEVVADPHWVTLPPGLPPGVYQVRVGVYDTATGTRRTISDPQNDAAGNSLSLTTFAVQR